MSVSEAVCETGADSCFGCQCLCGMVFPHQDARWEAVSGQLCNARNPHRALFPDESLFPLSGPAALWEAER